MNHARPARSTLPYSLCAAVIAAALPLAMACADDDLEPNTDIEEQLQDVLDAAVANPDVVLPGAIAHYHHASYAPWSGAAGLADADVGDAMQPHDKYRGGSLTKPMLAVVTLQHVEEGTLDLDQTLPELLPENLIAGIANAERITLRMLLRHTSGVPEWSTDDMDLQAMSDPGRVWRAEEFLEFIAGQPAQFEPGTAWRYTNTNYTLVGMVLERAGGASWRQQVRERILEPLDLESTSLPDPGDPSIAGDFARGYQPLGDQVLDLTHMDPSMAGAAGGHALITTAENLARFLEAVLAGQLFADEASLAEMTTMVDAPQGGPPHWYGLGIESYDIDGVRVIGHGGGTAGYNNGMFHVPARETTIVTSVNTGDADANVDNVILPALLIAVSDANR